MCKTLPTTDIIQLQLTFHNLITVELLLQSHLPQQMLRSSPPDSMHAWTLLMDFCTPSTGPGAVTNGLTDIKNVLVKCLFISNWSWIQLRFFKCPHRAKPKGLSSSCCWAVPQKLFADIYGDEIFPCLVLRISLLKIFQSLLIQLMCYAMYVYVRVYVYNVKSMIIRNVTVEGMLFRICLSHGHT